MTSALQGTLLLDAADTDLHAHLDTAIADVKPADGCR